MKWTQSAETAALQVKKSENNDSRQLSRFEPVVRNREGDSLVTMGYPKQSGYLTYTIKGKLM